MTNYAGIDHVRLYSDVLLKEEEQVQIIQISACRR